MTPRLPIVAGAACALVIAAGNIPVRGGPDGIADVAGGESCATATPVGLGLFKGTTVGASSDGTASCGVSADSPDVWFRYTAGEAGLLTVSTCGWFGYDTVLSVHSGCGGGLADEIYCNDNTCGLQSTTSAIVATGETIFIRVSGAGGASGVFILETSFSLDPPPVLGANVLYSDCTDIRDWGPVGGVRAYALEAITCNVGTQNLLWGNDYQGSPVLGMNAYRLENGRLVQIGMSWGKHGLGAGADAGCGLPCNFAAGNVLGIGCRDVYSAGFSGMQWILGPRSEVNAWTGALSPAPSGSFNDVDRRLQIAEADLDSATHPGALFFVEGVYVAVDDAGVFGTAYNNASHRRVTVAPDFGLNVVNTMQAGVPAIFAWQNHGAGPGQPDPSVRIEPVEVPGEGTFFLGSKVVDLGDGSWQYEYAIFNLSSDRSAASLTIPLTPNASISNVGFHDVDYHSGEVYDPTDWLPAISPDSVRWSGVQTHAQNPNANALRWGTMYNFWFTADRPPTNAAASIGLFKPGTPTAVVATLPGPGRACPPDLDGSGDVGFADILEVIVAWGPCPACPQDLDRSGDVGFADVLEVIVSWGPCPPRD